MISTLGPVAESVFALKQFGRQGGAPFQGWQKGVRERLGARVAEVEQLAGRYDTDELLTLLKHPGGNPDAGGDERARQRAQATLFGFCQAAVLPHWRQMRGHLASVRDACGRISIANGMHTALDNLHPRLNWRPPSLEAPGEPDRDVHLNGRGLVLCPSLFLAGKTCMLVEDFQEIGVPVLVFSVPVDTTTATTLWGHGGGDEQALSALVGHTRAAVLETLSDSCTTGELSQRLNISLAGASKHAKVLRKAGLITTARQRNMALHSLTPLGVALLQQRRSAGRRTDGQSSAA
ncbi:helix-turn-helix transcriptional regulator [Actinoplanes sp. TFC3]|uniref:ArsR/SmtB family transcription factor n=1 Tax=Actinoplanes sp. TFC3 TaxID=1710355 RepID=UPI00082DA1A9|nr:winged helix-turn-helix domain-containing protein [Actinoplanes sp. TFC3]